MAVLHPYQPMREVAGGLFCVDGRFGRSPLGRRMSVVVLPSGGVAVHSAIRMAEPDMAALEALGPVRAILVPNTLHTADAPWYAGRYPQAALLAPAAAVRRLSRRMRVDGTLEDDWSEPLAGALERLALGGTRMHEVAFLHRASRTLILTDLAFNLGTEHTGLRRWFLELNQAYGRFGPSRLFRSLFLRDPAALRTSLEALAAWDYDRVVVGHGAIVEHGGKARMAEAFAFLAR